MSRGRGGLTKAVAGLDLVLLGTYNSLRIAQIARSSPLPAPAGHDRKRRRNEDRLIPGGGASQAMYMRLALSTCVKYSTAQAVAPRRSSGIPPIS